MNTVLRTAVAKCTHLEGATSRLLDQLHANPTVDGYKELTATLILWVRELNTAVYELTFNKR